MKPIVIPGHYNYIGTFITLACNLSCSYCINYDELNSSRLKSVRKPLSGKDWIEGINRLQIGRDDLPVTFQGGEPTIHKDFYEIVNGIRDDIKLDLLTNMMFDVDEFIRRVPPRKFSRLAKYAAIRVSYHPEQNDIKDLIYKTQKMTDAGFYVGIYSVAVPAIMEHIRPMQDWCLKLGIDFRLKEYLGFDGQQWHGTYRYPESVAQMTRKFCECKTTELIVAPDGHIFRCHSDLYANRAPIGHILDSEFEIKDIYRPCYVFGYCNPCDVKVKTNRFQQFGHTSVDIKNMRELTFEEKQRLENGNFGFEAYEFKKARI